MFLQYKIVFTFDPVCLHWLKMYHKIITSSQSNMLRRLWVDYCKHTMNVYLFMKFAPPLFDINKKVLCLLRFMHCSNTAQIQRDFWVRRFLSQSTQLIWKSLIFVGQKNKKNLWEVLDSNCYWPWELQLCPPDM